MTSKHDPVNNPSHYNQGRCEVLHFCKMLRFGPELFSAARYLTRAGYKDPAKEVEDLDKARFYLEYACKQDQGTLLTREPTFFLREGDDQRPQPTIILPHHVAEFWPELCVFRQTALVALVEFSLAAKRGYTQANTLDLNAALAATEVALKEARRLAVLKRSPGEPMP